MLCEDAEGAHDNRLASRACEGLRRAQHRFVDPAAGRAALVSSDARPREVRISNRATYWPVAPIDLVVGAPIVARILVGASPAGMLLQAAALGLYAGSALRDWRDRQGMQRVDFRREFGADVDHLVPMTREAHLAQIR